MTEPTKISPQLKYIREARADPLYRAYELEKQRERRNSPEYRAYAKEYFRNWKKKRKDALNESS